MLIHDDERIVTPKGGYAGRYFVKRDTEGIEIALLITWLAFSLFWRDVERRTD